MFERSAAFFVVLKLIEAGAGRGQQDGVAGLRVIAGVPNGAIQRAAVDQCNRPAKGLADQRSSGIRVVSLRADKKSGLRPFVQRAPQRRVIAPLVFSPENNPVVARE